MIGTATNRIVHLEREVTQIRQALRQIQTAGAPTAKRQPRLAVTCANPLVVPPYPVPPEPPSIDPETGETIPGDPHPNTFPFVFADAGFVEAAGLQTPFGLARQTDLFQHVHNLSRVYIPIGTFIDVFEDSEQYWTSWNDGTSTPPTTPPTLLVGAVNAWRVLNESVPTSNINNRLESWDIFYPNQAALNALSLEYDSSNKWLVATADTTFFTIGTSRLSVGDSLGYTPGSVITIQWNLQQYDEGGAQAAPNNVLMQSYWQSSGGAGGSGIHHVAAADIDYASMLEGHTLRLRFSLGHDGDDDLVGEDITADCRVFFFKPPA